MDQMLFVDCLTLGVPGSPMDEELGAEDGCGGGSGRMRPSLSSQELPVWPGHGPEGKGCMREAGPRSEIQQTEVSL